MTLQQQASCKKTWACCDGYAFAHVPGPLWLVNSPHKYYFNCLQANSSFWIARDHERPASTGLSRLKIKEVVLIYVKINIDSYQFPHMKQNSLNDNEILFSAFVISYSVLTANNISLILNYANNSEKRTWLKGTDMSQALSTLPAKWC